MKIWLKNPTVATELASAADRVVRVHAWPASQNDFATAMMRLDEGDVLYALTEGEFEELRARAGAGAP